MSLCIAWKFGNEVNFAADSRMTLADGRTSDLGVKIVSVPVRIISPIDHQTRNFEVLFEAEYGLAFSGSYLSGYVIREMISEILSHLQTLVSSSDIGIESLMEIVGRCHSYYTRELRVDLDYGQDLDFMLAGRCPASGDIRTFKFVASEDREARFEEVLIGNGFQYEAIGAGEDALRMLVSDDLARGGCKVHFMMFERLRGVIQGGCVPSVGGRIQTGGFESGSFVHFGMLEFETGDEDIKKLPSIRGLVTDYLDLTDSDGLLHIHYTYKTPFTEP